MVSDFKIVISVSRRTDIPAFYMPWFMRQIEKGSFKVVNPFNQRVFYVPATPEKVHTIVFWSKNFGPFIENGYGDQLRRQGYNLFFNFTINSESSVLEPKVPPLEKRLEQLENLCRRFDPATVNWRFDPLCFFKSTKGQLQDNLGDFARIAAKAAEWGILRCITSFLDVYPKIHRRLSILPGFEFVEPSLERKVAIILEMEKELATNNIQLSACCEKTVVAALPRDSSVTGSSCIPTDLIMQLFGGRLSLKKDTGQRVKAGCGCKLSADIGSYRLQPCYHNCLFCYANPAEPVGERPGSPTIGEPNRCAGNISA